MDDEFDSTDHFDHITRQDSVVDAYLAADDPEEWLWEEVASFLSAYDGDALDGDEVAERLERLADHLDDRISHLNEITVERDELLGFAVEVFGEGSSSRVFREVLHPVELLWLLAVNAEVGDVVVVTHHYVDDEARAVLEWPFGMAEALVVTSPDPRQAYDPVDETEVALEVPLRALAAAVAAVAAVVLVWRRRRR